MDKTFTTDQPVNLFVEIGKGTVELTATDTTESHVSVTGEGADDVHVEMRGTELSVVAPRQRAGFFKSEPDLHVRVTVPTGSEVGVRTGSADITGEGSWGTTQVKTGSGEIRFDRIDASAVMVTGSGDVALDDVSGELRAKSGSGDISVGRVDGSATITTGSGDIEIGHTGGATVAKTGSGDLRLASADHDVSFTTGSGEARVDRFARGRLTLKGASGDVEVGIPSGTPVWTDISTVTGRIRSDLQPTGAPEEGADHVELRAKTASGDIVLHQL